MTERQVGSVQSMIVLWLLLKIVCSFRFSQYPQTFPEPAPTP